jgi:succinate-semialdehyde dehydrogenase/glutarate-semialdehyde dehydrogenase
MSAADVDYAIAKAHDCLPAWRRVPSVQRATFLHCAAGLGRERVDDLATLMALEMGKRIAEGREEVELCARIFEYYAHRGEEFLRPQTLSSPLGDGTLLNEPLGVLFGIQPWNYPCYQVVCFATPNLMAGNVVLSKHSTRVQQCAEASAYCSATRTSPRGLTRTWWLVPILRTRSLTTIGCSACRSP